MQAEASGEILVRNNWVHTFSLRAIAFKRRAVSQEKMGKLAYNAAEVHHRNIHLRSNGMSLGVHELGSAKEAAPTVLLLHGFPECWYSWRYQMDDLLKAGYHVLAPDLRGYGRSDAPESPDQYTSFHVVGDLVGLLDALSLKQVHVVGHDWGAIIAWDLCLLRPDRVKSVVIVSAPFGCFERHPDRSSFQAYYEEFGDGLYMAKFQEPGKVEADFARIGTLETLRLFMTHPLNLQGGESIKDIFKEGDGKLPPYVTEEDLKYYTEQFERSGFTGPVNYYRAMDRTWELKAPWTHVKVETPMLYVAGDKDVAVEFPGAEEFLNGGGLKALAPSLQDAVLLEGGHFIHQQQAKQFNEIVIKFLKSGGR